MIKQSKYNPDKIMSYRKDGLFVVDSFNSSMEEMPSERSATSDNGNIKI